MTAPRAADFSPDSAKLFIAGASGIIGFAFSGPARTILLAAPKDVAVSAEGEARIAASRERGEMPKEPPEPIGATGFILNDD